MDPEPNPPVENPVPETKPPKPPKGKRTSADIVDDEAERENRIANLEKELAETKKGNQEKISLLENAITALKPPGAQNPPVNKNENPSIGGFIKKGLQSAGLLEKD